MLAGRKLLLADDSITIQKVVALTFADEGIEVLAVSNGADAIEKLQEFWPDIVLADVYMPRMTGLQVCDYIKRNEQLKHIPVMLLVGSFEPFDEAEARKVGADDTLTKPFQSIRTLVEKVGVLLGREPVPDNIEKVTFTPPPAKIAAAEPPAKATIATEPPAVDPVPVPAVLDGASTLSGAETLEFGDREKIDVPEVRMDAAQLERTTADTRPLSPEIRAHLQQTSDKDHQIETVVEKEKMQTHLVGDPGVELSEGLGDTLLDLDDFEAVPLISSDDVILDIDFDTPADGYYSAPAENWQSAVAVEAPASLPAVTGDHLAWTEQAEEVVDWEGEIHTSDPGWAARKPVSADALGSDAAGNEPAVKAAPAFGESRGSELLVESELAQRSPSPRAVIGASVTGQITLDQLSPEVIDAIARRAVELLSEKVVEEIAWEVVPQLAELLIKRKLNESK